MGQEDIIRDVPILNEVILIWCNNAVYDRLQFVNKDFGDYFIDHIAQTNRSKVIHLLRKGNFWNESYEGLVDRFKEETRMEKSLDNIDNISFNCFQNSWKKKAGMPSGLGAL